MPERAYTIAEIDRMRELLQTWRRGAHVEEHLRTYLMVGITPFELEAELKIQERARLERMRRERPEIAFAIDARLAHSDWLNA